MTTHDDGDKVVELPADVAFVRTTKVFDEHTVPRGLRSAHTLADAVWGVIVVESGSLEFVFDDPPEAPRHLGVGEQQVIPPARLHHVAIDGPVGFRIEFHR